MFNKLVEFAVFNRMLVFILTLLAAFAGWRSFQTLPIDAVPDITNVQVVVNTSVEGLAPEEIERYITFPIENSMGGIGGVEGVRSITRFGLSQVTIVFEEGTSIYLARQMVAERLQGVTEELPQGAKPEMGPITSGLGEIFHYTIEAKEAAPGVDRIKQLMELKQIQQWQIKPRLLTVKGVAEVNTIGGFEKQYYVQPDPAAMARYRVHIEDLVSALRDNNKNTGGGYVQQTTEQFLVQATGIVQNVDDIKSIPVKTLNSFKTVRVGDIAVVKFDKELRTGAALVNGKEAVVGSVLMLLGENSRTVSLRVGERLKELQTGLPDWVELKPLYNRSDLVNATLSTVEHNLLFGAFLVIVILLVLVGNLRVALITALTIPLSLLITFIIMKFQGVSGNLMSLGALDFGVIIDGAVIVMDNCARFVSARAREYGRNLTRAEVQRAVADATIEIRKAAGFGQLVIVVVFLPILALEGVEGKMFVPMAATFCFALLAAFVLAFTTIPALAGTFMSGKLTDGEPKIMQWLKRAYLPLLTASLKWKKAVVIAGAASVVLGAVLFGTLGGEFLPQLDEGSLALQFVRPANISIDQSVEMQKLSEDLIREFPEVDLVFARIGTAEIATDPMGPNIADTYIILKDHKAWPEVNGKRRSKLDLVQAITGKLEAEIPGQRALASQPIQLRFNELLEGVRADVSLKIFGDDLDKINELAAKVVTIVGKVPGAGDVEQESAGKSPVLTVSPKENVIASLGAGKKEILDTVAAAVGGAEAGHVFEGVMKFPIIVRMNEQTRADIEALGRIPVGVGENLTVPLSEIANLNFRESASSISRESSKKRSAVLINPRGRDTASFVADAQAAVASQVKLPNGYYFEWGGNFKNLERAKERLVFLGPIALIVIMMMIFTAFKSFLQTAIIFACVPMALVGGVLGLIINGLPFSVSAGVGFIALSGIAVLNGVVLVSYFNQLKLQGMTGDDLVKEGALVRLRPVLMTALAAIFGFLPMMIATGVGSEVQRPLASVVVGGIISATILTLIVLPSIYALFEKRMTVVDSGMSH
jgi:heavy metal efflux system protein